MQVYKHLASDDTASATLRLNKYELKDLRQFMHTPDYFKNIGFPNGVRLYYRSMGWYRLGVTRQHRACDKIRSALIIIRKWCAEYQTQQKAEIQRLILEQNPHLKCVAFVDTGATQAPVRIYRDQTPEAPTSGQKVDPRKLQRLAHKFQGVRS